MEENNEFLVSMTKSLTDLSPVTITEEQVVELIRSDKQLERQTEEHRYLAGLNLEKDADKVKAQSPRFLPSGQLEGGTSKKNITYYNGHGMVDIDDATPERLVAFIPLLKACPFVHIAYVTISGFGIRIIYRTDATDERQHLAVFSIGNEYFSNLLHCPVKEVDVKCKNINRMSGLAHDANVIYRPDSERFHIPSVAELEEEKKEKKAVQRKQRNQKAYAEKAGVKAQALLETQGKHYEKGSYNDFASSAVFLMNKFGVEKDETLAWAETTFDDYNPADLESIVRSVYENHSDEHGTMSMQSKGRYINVGELEGFIASQANLRYNTVTGFNEICWKGETAFTEMTDYNENTLWARSMKAGIFCHPTNIQCIVRSEFVPRFNPIISYLDALPAWDGVTDYIAQVASRIKTGTPELFEEYFRKWFVAMVASMLDAEIVNHCILMLIGGQGKYKTTFFSLLLPPELQRYFNEKIELGYSTKDDLFKLTEAALICLEEVDTLSPSAMNQLKAMITVPSINERPAYGRNKEFRYHLATFCGTGNNEFFLTDDTGSRRWLNFKVESMLPPRENPLPYEGLYAQAVYLFRNGFRYWFSEEEIQVLQEHNHAFEAINMEEELIAMHYRVPREGERGMFITTAEIVERINLYVKYPLSPNKVSRAMNRKGFTPYRLNSLRGFIVIELTDDEKKQIKEMPPMKDSQQDLPF
ncbi:VapE domain-containing protein [Phocaeicola sp.]